MFFHNTSFLPILVTDPFIKTSYFSQKNPYSHIIPTILEGSQSPKTQSCIPGWELLNYNMDCSLRLGGNSGISIIIHFTNSPIIGNFYSN